METEIKKVINANELQEEINNLELLFKDYNITLPSQEVIEDIIHYCSSNNRKITYNCTQINETDVVLIIAYGIYTWGY